MTGGSRENKLYLQNLFFFLHQANMNTTKTHKHRNIQHLFNSSSSFIIVTIIINIQNIFHYQNTFCKMCEEIQRNTEPLRVNMRETTKYSDRLRLITGFTSSIQKPKHVVCSPIHFLSDSSHLSAGKCHVLHPIIIIIIINICHMFSWIIVLCLILSSINILVNKDQKTSDQQSKHKKVTADDQSQHW